MGSGQPLVCYSQLGPMALDPVLVSCFVLDGTDCELILHQILCEPVEPYVKWASRSPPRGKVHF